MKNFLLVCLILLVSSRTYAQISLGCGTHFDQSNLSTVQQQRLSQFNNKASQTPDRTTSGGGVTNSASSYIPLNQIIMIPVVVHVIHRGEAIGTGTNISDDQICSQINVLNEDFSRTNPDRNNTPADFAPFAASARIQFYLATRDPNGNPTNGITRTQTNNTEFLQSNNGIKSNGTGGHDPWDANSYLNLWVSGSPMFSNDQPNRVQIAGYAQFPWDLASKPNTDGVVIWNRTFGRGPFGLFVGFNLGHTTSHEVGHWLALKHIWGDDDGACTGSDDVVDTPNQANNSVGNPTFPLTDACAPNAPGVMFMNYMDYSSDQSRNMFTTLQVARMRLVFDPNQYRQNASYAIGRPIVGNEPVCNNSTFSIPNLPTGLNIVGWSSDNTNALTIDGSGSATRQNNYNGLVNITATIAHSCGTFTVTKSVNVGAGTIGGTYSYGGYSFSVNGSTGIGVSGSNNTITFNLANAWDPSTQYRWSVSTTGNVSYNLSNSSYGNITLGSGAQAIATCTVTTPCGTLSVTFNCYNYGGSYRMAAYPNPANQEMTVAAVKGSDQDDGQFQDSNMTADKPVEDSDLADIDADVRLVDKSNVLLREGKLVKGKISFSVAKLPDNIYYLQMVIGDKQIRKQIVIKH